VGHDPAALCPWAVTSILLPVCLCVRVCVWCVRVFVCVCVCVCVCMCVSMGSDIHSFTWQHRRTGCVRVRACVGGARGTMWDDPCEALEYQQPAMLQNSFLNMIEFQRSSVASHAMSFLNTFLNTFFEYIFLNTYF